MRIDGDPVKADGGGKPDLRALCGADIAPWLSDLARLRMEVFREFPYLYAGESEYEQRYLASYSVSPESVFVIAFHENEAIGLSTGLPLLDAQHAFQAPFASLGIDPATVFYFGESVLQRAWRGHGLGRRFMEEREAYARKLGRFHWLAFCAVERPYDHPSRPEDYRDLSGFWSKLGFERQPELVTELSWKEIGADKETPKRMCFWLKRL